jgi:hypothetical protein
MVMLQPNCPFQWVRPVAPLKHTTINVRASGDGLECLGGGAALDAAAAAAWRWRRQLGGSVAGAAVVAVGRRQRQWLQRQQLGGSAAMAAAAWQQHS